MRRVLLAAAVLMLSACAAGAGKPVAARCYHRNAAVETEIGYCEAVRVGDTLHVSGSVGQGDMAAAIAMAYDTIRATLEANGYAFADVVSEHVYATDLDGFIRNKQVRKAYYGDVLPSATWVQVQRLYLPAFVVEVEVSAEHHR